MSMHKTPLTPTEEAGLRAHGLQRNIGVPSQLADVFRQGVAWGAAAAARPVPSEQQILEATEKAGLWPNTVHHWLPAFMRYHAILEAGHERQKPLDDPRLQELFGAAITGAMMLGYQNSSPPPAGHWLTAHWNTGRAEAEKHEQPAAATQPIMTLAEFCAEAKRTGLTADTFAAALSKRPEFADCLPPTTA